MTMTSSPLPWSRSLSSWWWWWWWWWWQSPCPLLLWASPSDLPQRPTHVAPAISWKIIIIMSWIIMNHHDDDDSAFWGFSTSALGLTLPLLCSILVILIWPFTYLKKILLLGFGFDLTACTGFSHLVLGCLVWTLPVLDFGFFHLGFGFLVFGFWFLT